MFQDHDITIVLRDVVKLDTEADRPTSSWANQSVPHPSQHVARQPASAACITEGAPRQDIESKLGRSRGRVLWVAVRRSAHDRLRSLVVRRLPGTRQRGQRPIWRGHPPTVRVLLEKPAPRRCPMTTRSFATAPRNLTPGAQNPCF